MCVVWPQPEGDVVSVPRLALTRQEAAAAIGLGLTKFEEQVQPDLKVIRVGTKVLIQITELERWLEKNASPTIP